MEAYKDVVGYEGLYQVSNLGNVKSLDRTFGTRIFKSKQKKLSIGNHGYLVTNLMKNGKTSTKLIHDLVARAFLGHNTFGHSIEINHINENKFDNSVDNLELLVVSEHKFKTWSKKTLLTEEEKKERKSAANRAYRNKQK